MKNLQNKVIWITGASSGIGEELVKQFAQEGAKLVLSARRESELLRVKNSANLPDNQVFILPMDMLEMDSFADKFQQIINRFGGVDVMVHNAGISQRTLFSEMSDQDAKRLMDTNFTSVVALTRVVLPHFIQKKSGSFLVTSSVSGKIGTPYRTMYCASKHALQGFFDGLRGEVWKDGVQVTVVCPGYINTPISLSAIGKGGNAYGKMDVNQAKGIPVNICVEKMIKALKSGKHEIVIAGLKENFGTYLKRFAPSLLWLFTKNYSVKSTEE